MKSLVREARAHLGLSMADLGQRMGISPTSVSSLERNEAAGTAKTGTVDRALKAMGLESMVFVLPSDAAAKAREAARKVAHRVEHTMSLEGQALPDEAVERIYERALHQEMAKL